jgi:hypothetical protein
VLFRDQTHYEFHTQQIAIDIELNLFFIFLVRIKDLILSQEENKFKSNFHLEKANNYYISLLCPTIHLIAFMK